MNKQIFFNFFLIRTETFIFIHICLTERRYTDKHEWVTLQGNIGVVGISDYAQDALGDVVYAQLPDVGSIIKKEGKILPDYFYLQFQISKRNGTKYLEILPENLLTVTKSFKNNNVKKSYFFTYIPPVLTVV